MSDLLVELGANATSRRLIQALGLPLPMPQKLRRARGPWAARPLADRPVFVGAAGRSDLSGALGAALLEAGANVWAIGPVDPAWAGPSEAWSRPVRSVGVDELPDGITPHALICDATGASSVDDLVGLYDTFHPRLKGLNRCGRCVVVGRLPSEADGITQAAVRRGLEGFVRALAKEVGGKGGTANLILVGRGAEANLAGPLRWLLSDNSAFVTGQVLRLAPSATKPVWTLPLEGKAVLVTGAARGIGAATAAALAREGARVLCLDRPADAEPLAAVAAEVGGVPIPVDVTDPEALSRILPALGAGESLYAIVHNAGITRDKTLANMDRDRWDLTLAINLQAILTLTEGLGPHLADGGRVIALSSVAGIAGNFGQTNYSLSKAAVIGFIEAASSALAPRGITVNGIAPGFIETRLTAAIPTATREAGRRLSALVQGGLPVDIAEAVTFLASPGAAGLQGQLLRVCGGAFIGA
jgi:3-oxoacyl-[acyl-carrier protein] reductase